MHKPESLNTSLKKHSNWILKCLIVLYIHYKTDRDKEKGKLLKLIIDGGIESTLLLYHIALSFVWG